MKTDFLDEPCLTGVARREFVAWSGAALAVVGCGGAGESAEESDGSSSAGSGPGGSTGTGGAGTGGSATGGQATGGSAQGGSGGVPTPQCEGATAPDIEGPFYTPGAPEKSSLAEPGMEGVRLLVAGQVLDEACLPIGGAVVDIWQADDDGAYDNIGFVLRGTVTTDSEGRYAFDTIVPGHYLNGAQYRPAHIHVKVSAPGFVPLTTQLYFEGDPYNSIDPWFNPDLALVLVDVAPNEKETTFDFVLAAV